MGWASGLGLSLPTWSLSSAPPPLPPSVGTGSSDSSLAHLLVSATFSFYVSSSKTLTSLPSVVAALVLFVLTISSISYFSPVFLVGF